MLDYIEKMKSLNMQHYDDYRIKCNKRYKEIINENVKCLTFDHLYVQTIIYLYDQKILQIDENKINELKYQYSIKDNYKPTDDGFFYNRTYLGSFFGRMSKSNGDLCRMFLKTMWDDISENNVDNIIYFDTDQIFYFENLYFPVKIEFNYYIEDIRCFYFSDKKRYILCKNNIITNNLSTRRSLYNRDIESRIFNIIRADKLKEILS